MKKSAGILTSFFAIALLASSCGEGGPSKNSGDDQIEQPVQNSGTETEAARAKDAVKDSSNTRDSANNANDLPDTVTGSKPHH
ncbi:MAG TPA: hypothetical protein VK628_09530 [Flavitalea sp.]|nr:hypothetical protein [Flavitalea sp.]